MRATGNQAREMRHIHHEIGTDLIGNGAEGSEIPNTRISAAAGNDQLGLCFTRNARHFRHINLLVFAPHRIGHRLEPFAGKIGE